jgi:hypothetical protein
MRSLWRMLALRWLGGDGSEALTGDSAILEGLLLGGRERPMRTFDVRREPQVSRRPILLPDPERPFDPEIGPQEALRRVVSGRYSR